MPDERDQMYEQVLVLRCQAGSEQAFEEIVRIYADRLRYYLLKLLGSPDAAEDAVQDVWLDVYRGVPRLREPTTFRAWLYRIARDRAFRVLRRSRPERELIEDIDLSGREADEEDFTAEDAEQVHVALDSLSPEHREVLLLRFIEDLSYEDIAAITDRSVGTVKSRIHYAKRMLHRAIEEVNKDG